MSERDKAEKALIKAALRYGLSDVSCDWMSYTREREYFKSRAALLKAAVALYKLMENLVEKWRPVLVKMNIDETKLERVAIILEDSWCKMPKEFKPKIYAGLDIILTGDIANYVTNILPRVKVEIHTCFEDAG